MSIGSIENHRAREGGVLVYPVYSRRSQGLSIGINLFPDHKQCSFNCPYCEVFPFKTDSTFSLENMETSLQYELSQIQKQGIVPKDISFSGNGEPTLSPFFFEALKIASRIRDNTVPKTDLVVITNGAGLLNGQTFDFLHHAAAETMSLKIWLKLDAGTPDWYREINRSQIPYQSLIHKIKDLVCLAPITIQTMLCKVNHQTPPLEEFWAWEKLVVELTGMGTTANLIISDEVVNDAIRNRSSGIQNIQIYGKARPAPEDPLAEALPRAYLEARASSLKKAIKSAGLELLIEIFP